MLTEQMLRRSPALAVLNPVAAAHHEKTNGSGYHKGLRADAVDPGASVLAAADIYVALTTDRADRPAFSGKDAATSFAGSHHKARSSGAPEGPQRAELIERARMRGAERPGASFGAGRTRPACQVHFGQERRFELADLPGHFLHHRRGQTGCVQHHHQAVTPQRPRLKTSTCRYSKSSMTVSLTVAPVPTDNRCGSG